MKGLLKLLLTVLPTRTAYAHCDIPCGIYDPKPAQIAAATVYKMVQIIKGLNPASTSIEDRNTFVRSVWTKEEHARKCKEELLILWTDYFKPEHLEMFPDLHDTFWKAAKLCSKAKQTVDEQVAKDLVDAVNHIAEMYEKAHDAAHHH